MKKLIAAALSMCMLCGCAAYTFQQGKKPYDSGYVASRDGYVIPEYTIGQGANAPGLVLAKERFRRRRKVVEHYYKRMGYIENRFKEAFIDPPALMVKMIGGIFRLPFVALSEYRFEHDPAYRARVLQQQQYADALEEARIQKLKAQLSEYVGQDISLEKPGR